MKKLLLLAALFVCALSSYAQRLTTSSVSEYQQVYSKKYTFIKTTLNIEVIWEFTDSMIYRNAGLGPSYWPVTKAIKTGTGKKYILDAAGLDDIWVTTEGSYVYLFESGGQSKRAFRIIKREKLREL